MAEFKLTRNILMIALLTSWPLLAAFARADEPPAEVVAESPSYPTQAAALLEEIHDSRAVIGALEAARLESQGLSAMILDGRLQRASHRALDLSHQLCQLVIDQEAAGEDPGSFREEAKELLELIPVRLREDVQQRLASEDIDVDIASLSAVEQIALED